MSLKRRRHAYMVGSALLLLAGCGGSDASTPTGGSPSAGTPGAQPSAIPTQTPTPVAALTNFSNATPASSCATSVPAAPTSSAASTASFGLTSDSNFYTVDTGAGLVFKIRRTPVANSAQAIGDLASAVYNGIEYLDPAAGSQLNSGAGYLYKGVGENDVTVTPQQVDADHIKITVTVGGLTHYYMAHRGEAKVFMGTVFSSEPDQEVLARYIVRALKAEIPNGPHPSDLKDTVNTIEAHDIFATANGETRSKHYSNQRLRDWYYIGATGNDVGVWMVRGNSEGMSGGPFYRSLLNQGTDLEQQITYIINYGEAQTEAYRFNVLNTYALVFTNGSPPAPIDTSWYGGMGLRGWVPLSQRGAVTGSSIIGRDPNYLYTVALSNANAQYYTTADASGTFACSGILPGTYALQVFKNELAVASQSVTVSAGLSTPIGSISAADPSAQAAVWRIGDWDGSPQELLNGDKVTTMHPSDVRMASWTPSSYTIGTSTARQFPAYSWKDVNGVQTINFQLAANQVAASKVRIGITTAYAGGRPVIRVNNWSSGTTTPSSQPSSRTLTIGSYRGNNTLYTFDVPASALVAGNNTLAISVVSGSGGSQWLSAGVSYDAIDFIQP